MKKTYLAIFGLCAALALPAHAANNTEAYSSNVEVKQDASGDYDKKATVKSTDAAGTDETIKHKEDVDVDSGGTTTTSSTTDTVDPKGLGNETKTEENEKTDVKANGDMDSKTVAETKKPHGIHDKAVTTKSVGTTWAGHKKSKVVQKKTHHTGLFSGTSEKTTDTTVELGNGQTEQTHVKTVNGKTVEKTNQVQ
jgi:hypothetical protein